MREYSQTAELRFGDHQWQRSNWYPIGRNIDVAWDSVRPARSNAGRLSLIKARARLLSDKPAQAHAA